MKDYSKEIEEIEEIKQQKKDDFNLKYNIFKKQEEIENEQIVKKEFEKIMEECYKAGNKMINKYDFEFIEKLKEVENIVNDLKFKISELNDIKEDCEYDKIHEENLDYIESCVDDVNNNIIDIWVIKESFEEDYEKLIEEFNDLVDRKKWSTYDEIDDIVDWVCPNCGTIIDEIISPIFDSDVICCDECWIELTHRTKGGQNDPFGWKAIKKDILNVD